MDIILYLLNYIQYQHQQICWLLNFICRYIPLKQWAFDDSHSPKYQKFKIDKLPVIKPLSDRTGSSFSNTISGSMGNLLSRFSVAMVNPFPKTPSVHYAVPLTITSTIIMVETGNTSARSADRLSHPAKLSPLLSGLPVLIAAIPWLPRKTASSSAYTNVSIPNVLTISTILKSGSEGS